MKRIDHLVAFPKDAQSSPFFGALATVLLPALGYGADTPFYCAPKGTFCIHCGNCTDSTALERNHLQIYHEYATRTGVALGWSEPDGLGLDDDFVRRVMGIAGLSWKRVARKDGRAAVFRALKAAIEAGYPALMKRGDGRDWLVVGGYEERGRLVGLDAHAHFDVSARPALLPDEYTADGWFVLSDWFSQFRSAIVMTGGGMTRTSLADTLVCMIDALESAGLDALEREVLRRIDAVTPDNAYDTAVWLNGVVGYPIEARWHTAECAAATLMRMTENPRVREKLFAVARQYVFDGELDATHGTCWKIWALLGVGSETGYSVAPETAAAIAESAAKEEGKRLFQIVFENDRVVLGLLREARELLACE